MTRILPPDVTEDAFAAALTAFRAAIGEENVITDDAGLERYRDPYAVEGPGKNVASAAVLPGSTADVQAIVRIANDTGVPISVISTGKNLSYGGGAPRLSGAVVVDTGKRMNRVLEVNEKVGYAVVEPGVSYFDLYEHLQSLGGKYWVDTPDLGWGSVVGNALDRGAGYTPFGDHWGAHAGLEVVTPTGEVIRTGTGSLPGSKTWHSYAPGFGPYLDGMFTQSNYGIVTNMGIALMPAPPGSRTHVITFENEDDIELVLEITNPLVRSMQFFQNLPILRSILLDGGVMSKKADWYDGPGPIPAEAIDRLKKDLNLGYWNMYFTLYGPPEATEQQGQAIWSFYKDVPGAKFYHTDNRDDRGAHVLHDRHKISSGVPSLSELSLMDWIPNGGHLTFSPASPPDGDALLEQFHLTKALATEYGVDFCSLVGAFGRICVHVCLLIFDTSDPEACARAHELGKRLIKEAASRGYGDLRAHNSLMDYVATEYSWNDNSMLRFQESIKDAIDPAGILAPGKSGIWPARYRGLGL
jgi:4-cresol dehydrogenase (hydroxylating) flavoprotein subunit